MSHFLSDFIVQESIGDRFDIAGIINNISATGQFVMGKEVKQLEAQLERFTGASYVTTCGSGTDALTLILRALDIREGDEVITSAFDFIAAAETIINAGATPRFADIDKFYTIDPGKVLRCINKKTRAVIATSLFGHPADFYRLGEICMAHELHLIEDAAQSMGAVYGTKKSGNLCSTAATSFFPTKPLAGLGDGGAVFSSNYRTIEDISRLRNHGQYGRYNHVACGYNSRLDTIQAAILSMRLKRLQEDIYRRNKIARQYTDLLKLHFTTPQTRPSTTPAWAQYTLRTIGDRAGLINELTNRGIGSAIHYPRPVYAQPAVRQFARREDMCQCPEAEKAASEVFSIPIHPMMTENHVDFICDQLITLKQKF